MALYYGVPFRARRMRRFYSRFVRAGDLCFDVGAHAGNRVRCFRQLGARVVAIEPQADFVRLLELLYGTGARISEAVGLAVDDLDRGQATVRLAGKGGRAEPSRLASAA